MQIPENQLKELPTFELIDAYRKSRFIFFILAYNNVHEGFERGLETVSNIIELTVEIRLNSSSGLQPVPIIVNCL